MLEQGQTNDYTKAYRQQLEEAGKDTSQWSDNYLTWDLGQKLERDGLDPVSGGADFQRQYLDLKNKPDPSMSGAWGIAKELPRGLRTGGYQAVGTGFDMAALGSARLRPRDEAVHDWLIDRADILSAKAYEKTPTIMSPSDIRWDWEHREEVARGLLGGTGMVTASLIQALGAGRLSGLFGKKITDKLVKRIPKTKRVTRKVDGVERNMSLRDAKRADFENFFTMGGVATNSIGMNAGEIYGELYESTLLPKDHEDYISPEAARDAATVGGIAAGGLDMIMPAKLLSKFLGKGGLPAKRYWKRFMASLPENVVWEGGAEAGQEFIGMMAERYARGEEMDWETLSGMERKQLLDAGILGMIGGTQGAFLESMYEGDDPPSTPNEIESDRIKREAETAVQAEAQQEAQRAFENRAKSRTFEVGELLTDIRTDEEGEYIGPVDKNTSLVSRKGEIKQIPNRRLVRQKAVSDDQSIAKGDYVTYTSPEGIKIAGNVTHVKAGRVYVAESEYGIPIADVKRLRSSNEDAIRTSVEKATDGKQLGRKDLTRILQQKGVKNPFNRNKKLTKSAKKKLEELEFSDDEYVWSYRFNNDTGKAQKGHWVEGKWKKGRGTKQTIATRKAGQALADKEYDNVLKFIEAQKISEADPNTDGSVILKDAPATEVYRHARQKFYTDNNGESPATLGSAWKILQKKLADNKIIKKSGGKWRGTTDTAVDTETKAKNAEAQSNRRLYEQLTTKVIILSGPEAGDPKFASARTDTGEDADYGLGFVGEYIDAEQKVVIHTIQDGNHNTYKFAPRYITIILATLTPRMMERARLLPSCMTTYKPIMMAT